MPTYEFCCNEDLCQHEWEDFLSMNAPDPEVCPKCNKHSVKRLISLGSRGVVELTGHELVAKTKEDIVKLKQDMQKSDKVYSNMLGEDKYHNLQLRLDKQKRDKVR